MRLQWDSNRVEDGLAIRKSPLLFAKTCLTRGHAEERNGEEFSPDISSITPWRDGGS